MPLNEIFIKADECKEHTCKINRSNIKNIFKPEKGFLNKQLEQELLGLNYKICDCIIECQNGKIVVVEILCGRLTYGEFKDKIIQLENCIKILKSIGLSSQIINVYLVYKSLDKQFSLMIKSPPFKKKLLNLKKSQKISLLEASYKAINIDC